MRAYSMSQGKFIDTPEMGGQLGGYNQPTTGGGMMQDYGGGQDEMMNKLMMAALTSKLTGKSPGFSDVFEMLSPKESAETEKQKMGKEEADRIVTELEDQYYSGPAGILAYAREGNRTPAITEMMNTVLKGTNPDLKAYLAFREAIRPKLVKAMDDVGNFSLPEQQAAVKDVPTAFSTPEEAELYFKGLRTRLGISPRKLTTTTQTKQSTKQTGVISTKTPDTTTGAEIPYGALGQIMGGFLPFPLNIAAAGGIGGLGTAIPQTKERASRALEGDIPSYPQQLQETFSGMGQTAKTTGINALLQAILSPIKTFKGLRDIKAVSSPLTVSGSKIAQAGLETAETAPAAEIAGASKTALKGIERYDTQTMNAKEALAAKAKEWASAYTSQSAKRGGAANVSRSLGGNIAQQISEQDKFIATMDALQHLLYSGKRKAGQLLWRFGPWGVGLGAGALGGGYAASKF